MIVAWTTFATTSGNRNAEDKIQATVTNLFIFVLVKQTARVIRQDTVVTTKTVIKDNKTNLLNILQY